MLRGVTPALRDRLPLLTALALLLASLGARAVTFDLSDLEVYRRGAAAVLNGTLYAPFDGLPFTYTPFAAVAFVPLHAAGRPAAIVLMTAVSVASYVVIVLICARALALDRRTTLVAGIAGFAIEPVVHTFALGQVNLLLAVMVLIDLLVLPSRHRGWLVGIAAGVKLVPGVFAIYLLLRRDWWGLVRAAGGLAVTILLGWVVDHGDSHLYWTKLFYDDSHVGGVAYVGNQSLNGVLVRFTHDETPPTAAYLALALAALALAAYAAWRQLRSGNELGAVTAIAFGGLLASPISWTHHWVWLVPAMMVLWVQGRRVSTLVILALMVLAPVWLPVVPHGELREFHHTWWQAAITLIDTVIGVSVLALLAAVRQPAAAALRPERPAAPARSH
jgi:alpha-1,2-mannosyltransferase